MRKLVLKIVGVLSGSATATLLMSGSVMAQSYYDNGLYTSTYAANSAGLAGFSLVYICCILLCSLIPVILIAYFIYKDAVRNEVENPILWAAICGIFTLVGLLIYLLAIRPDAIKKMEMKHGMNGRMPEVPTTPTGM